MSDTLLPLVDDWPFPLFKLDDSDQVIWANQAAQEWLGKSLKKFREKRVWSIFETDPFSGDIALNARDKGGAVTSRYIACLLYTSPSPRDKRQSRMPSSA